MPVKIQSTLFGLIAGLFLLIGLCFVALSCAHTSPVENANRDVVERGEAYVREAFADLDYKAMRSVPVKDSPRAEGEPAMVWRGASSKVIAVLHPKSSMGFERQRQWTVYAQNSQGHYYAVTYALRDDADDAVRGTDRLALVDLTPLREADIMRVLVDRGLTKVYAEWFGSRNRKVIDA